jgi:hypothetical protein
MFDEDSMIEEIKNIQAAQQERIEEMRARLPAQQLAIDKLIIKGKQIILQAGAKIPVPVHEDWERDTGDGSEHQFKHGLEEGNKQAPRPDSEKWQLIIYRYQSS